MRTQRVVEHQDGELVPGSFASVHFDVTSTPQALLYSKRL
jgi:hypothetical protein